MFSDFGDVDVITRVKRTSLHPSTSTAQVRTSPNIPLHSTALTGGDLFLMNRHPTGSNPRRWPRPPTGSHAWPLPQSWDRW